MMRFFFFLVVVIAGKRKKKSFIQILTEGGSHFTAQPAILCSSQRLFELGNNNNNK
eukprot:gene8244-5765_t